MVSHNKYNIKLMHTIKLPATYSITVAMLAQIHTGIYTDTLHILNTMTISNKASRIGEQ